MNLSVCTYQISNVSIFEEHRDQSLKRKWQSIESTGQYSVFEYSIIVHPKMV